MTRQIERSVKFSSLFCRAISSDRHSKRRCALRIERLTWMYPIVGCGNNLAVFGNADTSSAIWNQCRRGNLVVYDRMHAPPSIR